MPLDFQEVDGLLMATDGFGPVIRWDGRDATFVNAGLEPPATALTIGSSGGAGEIVGTFVAYQRFLDALGNFSNLSPVSNEHTAQNTAGTITDATNATPIVITTSVAHGLSTGFRVKVSGVGGNTDANGTWLITVIDTDEFSLDGSSGNAAYTGGGTFISGVAQIDYTSVPVPTDAKVTLRQILRNTDGQEDVFYVDVETTDLGATTFSSTRDDEELSTQESQAILDSLGETLANRHVVPPDTKTCLAFHNDSLFFFGEEDYTAGACKVVNASATVTGVATDWNESLEGRFLHVDGAANIYEIDSVNVDDQTLTLVSAYADPTDKLATYAIRSSTYESKQVLFSEPGEYESVPPTNALQIRQNGDRITGGYSAGPYIYIVENRHIHRVIFGESLRDSQVFPASERGCINQRCWALIEDQAFMLDEQGCHVFSPDGDQTISDPIQDIFRPSSKSRWRINWRARKHFHCVIFEQQDTVRWFVALAGSARPQHALAYNFRLKRWWVEEYPRPISASCVGRMDGIPVVFLGTDNREVCAFWQGYQDFVNSSGTGSKRGTATASSLTTMTDSLAAFESTAVGAYVHLVDGTGRGQRRRIVERTATTLTVQYPWLIKPDTTTVYQVGGVHWLWRSKRFRLPETDKLTKTQQSLLFEPTEHPATLDMRQYQDFSRAARTWKNAISSSAGDGLRVDEDKAPFPVDMQKTLGYVKKSMDRHKAVDLDGPRFASFELSGVANNDPVIVLEMVLDGVQ